MNSKFKISTFCALFALLIGAGLVPAHAESRGNMSDLSDSWFEFDPENNGESFSWEGEPFLEIAHEDLTNGNDMYHVSWANKDDASEDTSENSVQWRGGLKRHEEYGEEEEDAGEEDNENTQDEDSQTEFETDLSGDKEVPGPGNDNAEGWASVRLHEDSDLVCVDIEVSGIELPATAAHIHKAVEGQAGPVVLTLPTPNEEGDAYGCVHADSGLITDIMDTPEEYYVNVHSTEYPDGAVRGQLSDSEGEED